MTSFELHAPSRVTAGVGALDQIDSILAHADLERILLVTDPGIVETGLETRLRKLLAAEERCVETVDTVPREPSVSDVEALLEEAEEFAPTFIVGMGGGSVLDTAKLMGVLIGGSQTLAELVDGVPAGPRQIDTLLIPTTAGTGSEATKNAILSVPDRELKVAIVSPSLLPRFVILDGGLTVSLPAAITATTGIDALAHALECFLSNKANELSDLLALKSTSLIHQNLKRAFDTPGDTAARQSMLSASFLAGMCITLSGTTAVHALSYPLGATFHVPHGQANAMLLPAVMRFNAPACPEKSVALADAFDIAPGGSAEERSAGFTQALENLVDHLHIPRKLSAFGVSSEDIPRFVKVAHGIRRLMDNNPREMTPEDMATVYEGVL